MKKINIKQNIRSSTSNKLHSHIVATTWKNKIKKEIKGLLFCLIFVHGLCMLIVVTVNICALPN